MEDWDIRLAAFDWLTRQVEMRGDVLPWALLAWGFEIRGERIPLVSQQGIFKPKALTIPISIRTAANGPYDDTFASSGLLRYKYRGSDPDHRDNVGLRMAMRSEAPLAYFHAISKGRYLAIWPVYIVGDDPSALTFSVAVDDAQVALPNAKVGVVEYVAEYDVTARREYVTALVRRRVHQRSFREKVLRAYQQQCALCRLRHDELLDAAHIISDSEEGPPVVRNGLALCKLHHAAFDAFFLTVRPENYHIVVRDDILRESDGPMLIHGLQGLDGRKIFTPRNPELRPEPELLARRFERFLVSMHA